MKEFKRVIFLRFLGLDPRFFADLGAAKGNLLEKHAKNGLLFRESSVAKSHPMNTFKEKCCPPGLSFVARTEFIG